MRGPCCFHLMAAAVALLLSIHPAAAVGVAGDAPPSQPAWCESSSMCVWEFAAEGQQQQQGAATAVALSPDGALIATGHLGSGGHHHVTLHSTESRQVVARLTLQGTTAATPATLLLEFSPDSAALAAASHGTAALFGGASWGAMWSSPLPGRPFSAAFTPQDAGPGGVAFACEAATKVLRVADGAEEAVLPGGFVVVFSPETGFAAIGAEGAVAVMRRSDAGQWVPHGSYSAPSSAPPRFGFLAFLPDPGMILAYSTSTPASPGAPPTANAPVILSAADPTTPVASLGGITLDPAFRTRVSPDGGVVVTVGSGGAVRVFSRIYMAAGEDPDSAAAAASTLDLGGHATALSAIGGAGGVSFASAGLSGRPALWRLATTDLDTLSTLRDALLDPAGRSLRVTSWQGPAFCLWAGIECDAEGRVVEINLAGEATAAAALPDLSRLGRLQRLYLQGTGVVSVAGLPASLLEADLSSTGLAGEIPAVLLALPRLMTLRAKSCALHGGIPLLPPSLRLLDVSWNRLDGEIVSPLPPAMLNLMAAGNRLQGGLPRGEGLLRLVVNGNRLSGSLPAYPKLLMGQLQHNRLGGVFDPAAVPEAYYLDLSHNEVGGALPAFGATKLAWFRGHHNKFTGGFPFAAPQQGSRVMEVLEVNHNRLAGRHPTQVESAAVAKLVATHRNGWD